MEITIDKLKSALQKLNHKWFTDRPNIIGIRTALNIPDVFNDFLCLVYFEDGKEILKVYPITTDPGVYYQKHLLNPKGCAIMALGQYENCYAIGFHKQSPDHRALIEIGKINVLRDKDMDGIAGDSGTNDSGYFGCDIHGAVKGITTQKIGPWSAGCQVHANWENKEEMMNVCDKFNKITGNKFTYTLIKEQDLI